VTNRLHTSLPVPAGATYPLIISEGPIADVHDDIKVDQGREILRDFRVYTKNSSRNPQSCINIAERIRAIFHGVEFTLTSWRAIASAMGPIIADESDVYGRIVTVRFSLFSSGS